MASFYNIVEEHITNLRHLTMQNYVFVIDTNKQPLNPIHPKKARKLLDKGKAAVFRMYPFVIILKTAIRNPSINPCQIKIDPGSKITGFALVRENQVIWAMELEHRGGLIKKKLESRRAVRRSRRNRNTRYRKPRFLNRKRPEGWLPPSLEHRVKTIDTWVMRLFTYVPVNQIAVERVKFDTQKMQNPEISGVEYQQGDLAGYEVREYLLEKWGRKCTYCGIQNVPLQIEHIEPKSKGGSDRVSNLCLACQKCNQKKSNRPIKEFYGYPIRHNPLKPIKGWLTGDIAKHLVMGIGKVTPRSKGSFGFTPLREKSCKSCKPADIKTVHRKDGYIYSFC